MNFSIKYLYFLFAIIIFFSDISAQDTLNITSEPDGLNLGKHCEYLLDEDGVFEIDEISSKIMRQLFRPISRNQPGFGYTNSAVWLFCPLKNISMDSISLYLEVSYPLLDDIRMFLPKGKGFQEIRTGDSYPFLQRPVAYRNFLFPMEIKSQEEISVYLRITNKGAVISPLYIWSEKNLIKKISSENIFIGLFIGICIVMILYNLFVYTFFKELHYLFYVLFLVGWSSIILTITGISFQYLWPNSIWWGNYNFPIMIFFTSVWALLFTRAILSLKDYSPLLNKILYYMVYVSALGIGIPFILDYALSIRISLSVIAVELTTIYISVILVFIKNKRISKYFLIAWSGFFIGVLIYQLHSFGWLATGILSTWSILIGASIAIILFALALADRINTIREEKEKAQEEVIQMQKVAIENIKTTQKQQEQLVAMNQELKIAGEIHQSILPQFIPDIKNVRIHVSYIPMAEIGGDIYEFIHDKESNSLGIFVADVTGHGIPAALLSSIMKATFTFHKKLYNKPDRLLKEINSTIISMENNQMVSAGYLYLDLKSRIAYYANSGHPPLLVWRKKSNTIESFYPEGKIIGWVEDTNNKLETIPFQKGDKFYLYTDGITDVRKNVSDIWGDENFKRFVLDHASLQEEDMIQELLQTLKNYSGRENGFEDDLTFIVIEIL
ncbi:MAG: SpoIIE family protein phosphatase [Leptospira sp.]|nr:SpoIIE family protein phosphatase [Leptospira sp.]